MAGRWKLAPGEKSGPEKRIGGIAGWLLERLRERLGGSERAQPRLTLVERIALAPRQSLALVEAEGRRILVANSAEGGPAFYALDKGARTAPRHEAGRRTRVSW